MSDEPQAKLSDPFTKMAEMIERNADAFGGAFVIVPPAGAGVGIQGLMLTSLDPAQFWLMMQSQINKSLDEAKNPNPYGARR